jgi:type II restriction/modification system DNA methylase subunit YeeA
MNKTAIKNFAIWARNKLISDITYKAGLLGITEKEIQSPLPQSTKEVQFFDIGTKEPYSIVGVEIEQREKLADAIQQMEGQTDYRTAYKSVVEEVAYTWFNRLVAVRFMEVNDYLPSRIRVLSSESSTKIEPDLVTSPFYANLNYTPYEKDRIVQMKKDNQLDELFRMLFIKQCNTLNAILPELFEKTKDYSELLMNVSFTDKDGVVYRLVHDISEDDFNVEKEGQIEIIGWMYQYYNTEPKNDTFALLKKNVKITKERIPSATQLFTPDWIVRYMVENSLGRLWMEGHSDDNMKAKWKYFLDEAEQEPDVQKQLDEIREQNKKIRPEDIKVLDPCMGSGHILVYAFDVLFEIYKNTGYPENDIPKLILENNLYGLEIDNRAAQLAYFAVMMKARSKSQRILRQKINLNLCSIQESNGISKESLNFFTKGMNAQFKADVDYLIEVFQDAKEYGSIIEVNSVAFDVIGNRVNDIEEAWAENLETILYYSEINDRLLPLVKQSRIMSQRYDVVCTNPPYMGSGSMNARLSEYIKQKYPDCKSDLFAVFLEVPFTKPGGYISTINQHSWMFLSSFEKLRKKIISNQTIINMLHLGARAFEEIGGEVVQSTAFILKNISLNYRSTFIRLVSINVAAQKEKVMLNAKDFKTKDVYFVSNYENFKIIPGMPIAYWVSKNLVKTFSEDCLGNIANCCTGMQTGNNDKYVRNWYEINILRSTIFETNGIWKKYNCGGEYRKWYGNCHNVVLWEENGEKIKNERSSVIRNEAYFFKEGLTWKRISSGEIGLRFLPSGFIFDQSGDSLFISNQNNMMYLLGLLNSVVAREIFKILSPTFNLTAGNMNKIPIINCNDNSIVLLVNENISIARADWDYFEISWEFRKHPFLGFKNEFETIENTFKNWSNLTEKQFSKLKQNEEELNQVFIDIYGLQDELTPAVEDKDIAIRKADQVRDIKSFISYAVGCMLGRYSIDVGGLIYAGGEWKDKWQLDGDRGRVRNIEKDEDENIISDTWIDATFLPDNYNILPILDDEYFDSDVVSRFSEFLRVTYGTDTLDENLDYIAKALGTRGNTSREIIRNYFLKDFFEDHCKVYQNRPIYWMFDSGKADGFKALVYVHRYNADTIGNLRIDYLHRTQRIYDSEIHRMQDTIENSTNSREVGAATKRKERLTKQLKETKEYDEKIAHLALARITIDLDDGVKVNYEKVQIGIDGKKLDVLAKI